MRVAGRVAGLREHARAEARRASPPRRSARRRAQAIRSRVRERKARARPAQYRDPPVRRYPPAPRGGARLATLDRRALDASLRRRTRHLARPVRGGALRRRGAPHQPRGASASPRSTPASCSSRCAPRARSTTGRGAGVAAEQRIERTVRESAPDLALGIQYTDERGELIASAGSLAGESSADPAGPAARRARFGAARGEPRRRARPRGERGARRRGASSRSRSTRGATPRTWRSCAR